MNVARWFVSLIGAQLLCGVVWVLGPLLPPFDETLPRAAVVAAIAVAWLVGNLALDLRRLTRERTLIAGVASAEDAEGAALGAKLQTAMKTLRQRGRRALYEQPWYVIIGPPGAGKTTALLNAGLEFPLAEQVGRGAVAGVGGTRLCEWWFTDQAVMIDTAGRYTTQDSDASVDKAGWQAFLRLLRRSRPRQPLNGVLVAIALGDVVGDEAERALHAAAIRRRIAELETALGVRLPVYALLTKVDLLAGFTEYFADLDKPGREQVWGLTLPLKAAKPLAGFAAEFKRWVGVLERRLFLRLEEEQRPEQRAVLSRFPAQFATVGAPVEAFLADAFVPPDRPAMLRGVYFTSATQEGTPFDRLTGALHRAFGLSGADPGRLRPVEGRSFFLARVLRDVVFREAMLGTASPRKRRRRALGRAAAFLVLLLLAAGAGAFIWQRQQAASAEIDRVAAALAAYETQAGSLPLDPVRDADLAGLVPLLDRARDLPFAGATDAGAGPIGLDQSAKLAAAAHAVYRHALDYALLPRLVWRLEAQIRGSTADPEFEYEATRVYLMLGGDGPLDRDLVRQWIEADWAQTMPAEMQAGLHRHLDALLDGRLPAVPLDGDVVAAARATFARVSVAQRVYSRIKPAAARLAPWRPSDALGAAGVAVFIRSSGKPLSDGISGFFTPAGFRDALLPALEPALAQVAAESWVLGQKTDLDPKSPEGRAAGQQVVALYAAEYIATWDAMLADIDVAPLRSIPQAAQDLFVLTSREHSPMRALLASVAANTDAAQPTIAQHYAPLRGLMQPGVIDQVLKPVTDLQQQLAKMFTTANRAGATIDPGSIDPATALQTEALRQPPPLSRWLQSIAASGRALRGGGAREQIVAAFKAGGGVGALCPQVVGPRYPFSPGAKDEVALDEFGRLFGVGGVIDSFFNTQLRPYVDTAAKPWKPQAVDGVSPPFAPADIAQFQRALEIRDTFFAGGTAPKLRFEATPLAADPAATLEVGDTAVAAGATPRPAEIGWPPPDAGGARLAWSGGPTLTESGPWALFRLVGRGTIVSAGPGRLLWTVTSGGASARFEFRTPRNPFDPKLLADFRCPALQ